MCLTSQREYRHTRVTTSTAAPNWSLRRLREACVVQQFAHLIALVATTLSIAVRSITFVGSRKPPDAAIDRGIAQDRAEISIRDDSFAVVAHENVRGAGRGEQTAQSIRCRMPRA